MNLSGLLPSLQADTDFTHAVELARHGAPANIVASMGVRPALLAAMVTATRSRDNGPQRRGPIVVVTATGREADELAQALRCYVPTDAVATLPAWETLPHERLSPRSDTVARRLAVFRRLAHPSAEGVTGDIDVLTVPVRALLQPVVQGLGDLTPVRLQVGDSVDLTDVAHQLADAAYARVDMVERRGEFAVRGGSLMCSLLTKLTHCASISLVTRSTTSPILRWQTNDLLILPPTVCGHHRAVNFCSPRRFVSVPTTLSPNFPGRQKCWKRCPRALPWKEWSH